MGTTALAQENRPFVLGWQEGRGKFLRGRSLLGRLPSPAAEARANLKTPTEVGLGFVLVGVLSVGVCSRGWFGGRAMVKVAGDALDGAGQFLKLGGAI